MAVYSPGVATEPVISNEPRAEVDDVDVVNGASAANPVAAIVPVVVVADDGDVVNVVTGANKLVSAAWVFVVVAVCTVVPAPMVVPGIVADPVAAIVPVVGVVVVADDGDVVNVVTGANKLVSAAWVFVVVAVCTVVPAPMVVPGIVADPAVMVVLLIVMLGDPVVNETECDVLPADPATKLTPAGTCLTEIPASDLLDDPANGDVRPAASLAAEPALWGELADPEEVTVAIVLVAVAGGSAMARAAW